MVSLVSFLPTRPSSVLKLQWPLVCFILASLKHLSLWMQLKSLMPCSQQIHVPSFPTCQAFGFNSGELQCYSHNVQQNSCDVGPGNKHVTLYHFPPSLCRQCRSPWTKPEKVGPALSSLIACLPSKIQISLLLCHRGEWLKRGPMKNWWPRKEPIINSSPQEPPSADLIEELHVQIVHQWQEGQGFFFFSLRRNDYILLLQTLSYVGIQVNF